MSKRQDNDVKQMTTATAAAISAANNVSSTAAQSVGQNSLSPQHPHGFPCGFFYGRIRHLTRLR